jgi:hypothetical protein
MQDALRAAIKAAGAPGLEIGAQVTLTYTRDETPGDNRSGKHYIAQYVRPANVTLMGGGGQSETAPAPVAQSAPAAQSSAGLAKQLIAVGLDDAKVAETTGLDVAVVAALRAG